MLPEPTYTQSKIIVAWDRYERYRNEAVLQVLKGGQWECAKIGDIGGNQARYGKRKTTMSFPKYLKKHYG